ncbi:MAG: aminotransferase class IV [Fusobacterium sp.]|nr:aminotransferase class IV [Fusobacterium sp.]
MKINLDEGYSFGLGLFETIHLYKNKPIFLKEHLERINNSSVALDMKIEKISEEEILEFIDKNKTDKENEVLKITLSEKNKIFSKRDYTYTAEHYKRGFRCNLSDVLKNETSVFTYHKTLNYADNISEKRKSHSLGFDEPIFKNSKNLITEGATTNIFFVRENKIFTPNLESGLLNGVVRSWIIKNYEVCEKEIHIDEIQNFSEIFLTNSLIGIMPLNFLGDYEIKSRMLSLKILEDYKKSLEF